MQTVVANLPKRSRTLSPPREPTSKPAPTLLSRPTPYSPTAHTRMTLTTIPPIRPFRGFLPCTCSLELRDGEQVRRATNELNQRRHHLTLRAPQNDARAGGNSMVSGLHGKPPGRKQRCGAGIPSRTRGHKLGSSRQRTCSHGASACKRARFCPGRRGRRAEGQRAEKLPRGILQEAVRPTPNPTRNSTNSQEQEARHDRCVFPRRASAQCVAIVEARCFKRASPSH